MNNKVASMVRDFGMSRVFDGIDFSELIQIDSGKFVFPVDVDGTVYFCEVDFVAKKEDYSPERDIRLYAEKVEKARISAEEKARKRAEKSKKTKTE
jgi:hypothetical protein